MTSVVEQVPILDFFIVTFGIIVVVFRHLFIPASLFCRCDYVVSY